MPGKTSVASRRNRLGTICTAFYSAQRGNFLIFALDEVIHGQSHPFEKTSCSINPEIAR